MKLEAWKNVLDKKAWEDKWIDEGIMEVKYAGLTFHVGEGRSGERIQIWNMDLDQEVKEEWIDPGLQYLGAYVEDEKDWQAAFKYNKHFDQMKYEGPGVYGEDYGEYLGTMDDVWWDHMKWHIEDMANQLNDEVGWWIAEKVEAGELKEVGKDEYGKLYAPVGKEAEVHDPQMFPEPGNF